MKEPSSAPIYACFLKPMAEVARKFGYALAVHGSMTRDLDVVLIPWTDWAESDELVVKAICDKWTSLLIENTPPETKPHGRKAWTLVMGGEMFIDLSVMPRTEQEAK